MPKENSYVEKKQKNPITYQNKDVISKIFGENLKEKSLAVYGRRGFSVGIEWT